MMVAIPTWVPLSCFFVAGPIQIWGNTGTSGAVEFLGVTRAGLEFQEQAYIDELKSDVSGGDRGAPGDFQYLGESHTITAELGRFNPTILAKYERRVNASLTARAIGTLIGCSGAGFQVVFIATNFVRFYTNVFINEPISYSPVGSMTSYPRLTFTGLQDIGAAFAGGGNTDGSPYKLTGFTVTVGSSGSPGTITIP